MLGRISKKWRTRIAATLILVLIAGAVAMTAVHTGNMLSSETSRNITPPGGPIHIISMAPNITETLFALGLGDRVAGVTRFCTWPPEAWEKPSVGGFLDPNYEMIASLRPDLVLLLPEHANVMEALRELGIPFEVVRNRTVGEILETIRTIGTICGKEIEAGALIADIGRRMESVRSQTVGGDVPKMLISVSREFDSGTIRQVYVAGPGTFYDELITCAGARNACMGTPAAYPVLSAEGLISLNPDIIIDLIPPGQAGEIDPDLARNAWEEYGYIKAVRTSDVHVIDADYAVIPGPRFILFLEDLAGIVHDWKVRDPGEGRS